jgi:2-polyprenyl-3-methyl-5-hydroxy-6-metoxy-1,4-benzoquinol methylase
MTDADLHRLRLDAAHASGGTSAPQIYRKAIEIIKQIGPGDRLLEYGAGQGNLVQLLRDQGLGNQITGADILPRPALLPPEIAWIEADLNLPLPLPESSFDAIVALEVIEHLENPRATMRDFFRLLRSGGYVLITTPNQTSLRSLLSLLWAGHFVDFLDSSYPAHITALLPKDFERICLETGFSPPQFFYTDQGGVPKKPIISWQKISWGLLKGRWFSDNMLVFAQKNRG